ncbi:hypothetical protein GILI108418_00690 [Gillisia limnaea]
MVIVNGKQLANPYPQRTRRDCHPEHSLSDCHPERSRRVNSSFHQREDRRNPLNQNLNPYPLQIRLFQQ